MPEATLKFNLPEEQEEFELATNATKYYTVLFDFDRILRNKIKHANDNVSDDYINALQMIRDELYEQLEVNNLTLD